MDATRVIDFTRELRRRKVFRAAGAYLVAAFVVLQVVDAAFPALPLPEGADTLVIVLLALGFPIVIGLAWALELTPTGLRRELTTEEAELGKRLRSDSIAVLPFENLSADPENDYFSDGITEDIIASIARIQGIRVLSRNSVLQYKSSALPVSDIGRELEVATVVTGSVRRSDRRLRIVARVVDARDGGHLWSDTFDRDLEDVFKIQSEVAARVAAAVRRELSATERSGIEARGTSDPEAYDLYLRARFLWNQRDEEAVAQSLGFFRRAIERDGGFALAHAGLADAYTVLGIYGARAPGESCPAAKAAARTALELEPGLGEAVASLACVNAVFDWDWPESERRFTRSFELSPSYATARQWFAMNALTPQSRFEEALRSLAHARELDSASAVIETSQGIVSFYAADHVTARRTFEKVLDQHPEFALARLFLGQCHEAEGRWAEAVSSLSAAVRHSGDSSEALAACGHALARANRTDEAEAVLERLVRRSSDRYVSAALLAQVLMGLGRNEEALDHLERAAEDRASDLIWIAVKPQYEPLADHPRFAALLGTLGLTRR